MSDELQDDKPSGSEKDHSEQSAEGNSGSDMEGADQASNNVVSDEDEMSMVQGHPSSVTNQSTSKEFCLEGDEGDLLSQLSRIAENQLGDIFDLGKVGVSTKSEALSFPVNAYPTFCQAKVQASRLIPALSPLIVGDVEVDRSSRSGRRLDSRSLLPCENRKRP